MTEILSKIVVVRMPNPNPDVQVDILSRADNGMVIGSCSNGNTQFGEDPNSVERRCFIDQEHGLLYLKQKCRDYLGRQDVTFLSEAARRLVQVPKVRL